MSKIPIAILGATGMVGQRMVQLLTDHPLFEIRTLMASNRSAGKRYSEACHWRLEGNCPPDIAEMMVEICDSSLLPREIRLVFSALDSAVAGRIEKEFYENRSCFVVSNAGTYRMQKDIPLIIPEVNPEQLTLLGATPSSGIITNPNCCAIPLALSLAPLHEKWNIKACVVSTWQAVSGAGYPGESSWDMVGTVHPHAGNEEVKLAEEPCKILSHSFPISARCVRVPVADGHLLSVQVQLETTPTPEEAIDCWKSWIPKVKTASTPTPIFHIHTRRDRPSPRFDIQVGAGMALSIGRVESCAVMGLKYFVLSHNTIRGAAGAAIANAELLVQRGML